MEIAVLFVDKKDNIYCFSCAVKEIINKNKVINIGTDDYGYHKCIICNSYIGLFYV